MTDAFWIILTGTLISAGCSLLGTFLLLRRMAMVGDAIAHAVLPGIVIAFLLLGSRNSLVMVPAAALTGVLTTVLIQWLHKTARVQSDASTGIIFTAFFALGVVLISAFAGSVDLDQDCVLYGEISFVPLDVVQITADLRVPRSPLTIGLLLLPILALLIAGYKGFQLTSFDPDYAASIGVSAGVWQYLLMALVSLMTVASFESVGAILVVAFLVVPPATAFLLSAHLKGMLLIGVLIGFFSSAGGYALAIRIDGSVAGSMAVVSGVLFVGAALFTMIKNKLRRYRAVRVG